MKHLDNGHCPRCVEIINRYKGFHQPMYQWFFDFQLKHPEAHVSEAGRGEIDQEAAFNRRASKARWMQSAHNYNCALDIFETGNDRRLIYETNWFRTVLANNIPKWITWYGAPGAKFPELPHVELKGWRELAKKGSLWLVEEEPWVKSKPS